MYLKDSKVLYVHVPKTGGQSVSQYLYNVAGLDPNTFDKQDNQTKATSIEELYNSERPNERFLYLKNSNFTVPGPVSLTHMTMDEYVDNGYISERDLTNTLVFATIRSPYTRLASACVFRNVKPNWKAIKKVINGNKDREIYRHFMRQTEYLTFRGKIYPDTYIAKTENLKEDLNNIFEIECSIDRLNAGRRNPDILHFNKDTLKWINDHYYDDFVALNYKMKNVS
jgi:hypothetical protein